jgi:plastocyanin
MQHPQRHRRQYAERPGQEHLGRQGRFLSRLWSRHRFCSRFLLIAAAATFLAVPAFAGTPQPTQIDIGDNFFNPKKPATRDFQAGVSFRWSSPGTASPHNVRQDDKLFYSGDLSKGPFTFPISASAGSYPYYCELHRDLGMTGVVKVRPVVELDHLQGEVGVQWADAGTHTGSRFDVRYRVDHRRWKVWKNDTTKFEGNFGHNDRPVNFRPSRHTYKVKVRSEKRKVKKHSDWSPQLILNP